MALHSLGALLRSRGLLLALLVGAGVRVAQWVWASTHVPDFLTPMLDAGFHHYWASTLVDSSAALPAWMDDPQLDTTPYYRPPGYVGWLAALYALFGVTPWAAHIAQGCLGLVGVVLVFGFTREVVGPPADGGSPAAAVAPTIAALLYASSPALLYFEGELVAASLASVGVVGWLWLFLDFDRRHQRPRDDVRLSRLLLGALTLGALLGLLCLLRPNLLVLLAPAGLLTLWPSRAEVGAKPAGRAAVVGALLVGVLATTSPITLRNLAVGGEAVWVSMNGPITARYGNHDDADGHHVRLPTTGVLAGLTEVSASGYPRVREHVATQLGRDGLTWGELSRTLRDETVGWATEHPGRFLALSARKAMLLLGPVEVSNNKQVQLAIDDSPVLRWLPGRWAWLATLAWVGALTLFRGRRRAVLLVVGSVSVVLCAVVPFLAAGRFRVPVLGLMATLGGLGAAALVRAVQRVRGRENGSGAEPQPWAMAGAALVGGVMFAVNWTGYSPDEARFHLDRATAFIRAERDEPALLELNAALAADPRSADALRRRGLLHARQGRADQALVDLEASVTAGGGAPARAALATVRAQQGKVDSGTLQDFEALLEKEPDRPDALYNYALSLFTAGRHGKAAEVYRRLLQQQPDHHDARNNLGRTLLALGDVEGALVAFDAVLKAQPAHVEASFNRAVALGRIDRARAEAAYRALLKQAPDHTNARLNLGALLLDSGRHAAAVEVMNPAATSDAAGVGLLFNFARAAWSSGDEVAAVGALRRARVRRQRQPTESGPGLPVIDLLLAEWLIHSRTPSVHNPAEAVRLTRAVVDGAQWGHPIPVRAYAAALNAAGQHAEAKAAASRANALCAAQPQAFGDACP